MSYILDALRRADAERDRGSVPSIHTQQQFTPADGDDERSRARSRPLAWIVGALALALIGTVAWILLRPEPVTIAATAPTRPVLPVLPPSAGTAPSVVPSASAPA